MKFLSLSLAFFMSIMPFTADDPYMVNQRLPEVGDTLVILAKSTNYQHIDFPRLNFLVKRGKLASYKSVHYKNVVIKKVTEKPNGKIEILLERIDGKKFFNQKKQVKANYFKALHYKELKIKK